MLFAFCSYPEHLVEAESPEAGGVALLHAFLLAKRPEGTQAWSVYSPVLFPFFEDENGVVYDMQLEPVLSNWSEDISQAEDALDIEEDIERDAFYMLSSVGWEKLLTPPGMELRCWKGRSLGKVYASVFMKVLVWRVSP